MDGQSSIVAALGVDPDQVVPAQLDQDSPRGPRTDLGVRAGLCTRHGPSRVAPLVPVDGLPLALPGLDLAPAPVLVPPGPVQVAQGV